MSSSAEPSASTGDHFGDFFAVFFSAAIRWSHSWFCSLIQRSKWAVKWSCIRSSLLSLLCIVAAPTFASWRIMVFSPVYTEGLLEPDRESPETASGKRKASQTLWFTTPDVYWKRDENGHSAKSACRTHLPQLFFMQAFARIVRSAGDCSREDYHAVYGIQHLADSTPHGGTKSPSGFNVPDRTRTCNLWLRRPTLYPIGLRRQYLYCVPHKKRAEEFPERSVLLNTVPFRTR